MNDTLNRAKDYALKLGIAPCMFGYLEFSEAVTEYVNNERKLSLKDVCHSIGKNRSVGSDTVFRTIKYAINTANGIREKLSELSGYEVRAEDIRPKYAICLVADCIERDLAE